LFDIGHETQFEFLSDQSLDESFGIWKILLPSSRSSVRLGLRQMQLTRPGFDAFRKFGPPPLFQRRPYRPPILRGRFHDDFLDLFGDQPVREPA
jgi:hypothetical protein